MNSHCIQDWVDKNLITWLTSLSIINEPPKTLCWVLNQLQKFLQAHTFYIGVILIRFQRNQILIHYCKNMNCLLLYCQAIISCHVHNLLIFFKDNMFLGLINMSEKHQSKVKRKSSLFFGHLVLPWLFNWREWGHLQRFQIRLSFWSQQYFNGQLMLKLF